ncbi:MAG: hypothetical protein JRF56_03410 [Deltaproteobacteria bacterium]|nr:hypothetical protein [Deltaproteobacteria bacterium]
MSLRRQQLSDYDGIFFFSVSAIAVIGLPMKNAQALPCADPAIAGLPFPDGH